MKREESHRIAASQYAPRTARERHSRKERFQLQIGIETNTELDSP